MTKVLTGSKRIGNCSINDDNADDNGCCDNDNGEDNDGKCEHLLFHKLEVLPFDGLGDDNDDQQGLLAITLSQTESLRYRSWLSGQIGQWPVCQIVRLQLIRKVTKITIRLQAIVKMLRNNNNEDEEEIDMMHHRL